MKLIEDLRFGRWEDGIASIGIVDAVITDGPYSARTHAGWNKGEEQVRSVIGQATRSRVGYNSFNGRDVRKFINRVHEVNRGWFACCCDDWLIPAYRAAYRHIGYYDFAPVIIIQRRPRLLGDGPMSSAVYLMVARPRTREFASWRCLPGDYISSTDRTGIVCGAKLVSLMRRIVVDYSNPGNTVLDTFAGGASTLIAARLEGRNSIGFEQDLSTYKKALARLSSQWRADPKQEQMIYV